MAAGLALAESAGAVLGRLRPDLQALFLLTQRAVGVVFFDSDPRAALDPLRSIAAGRRWGLVEAWIVLVSSLAGEHEQAWARIDELLAEPDLETLARRPSTWLPVCSSWRSPRRASVTGRQASGSAP